MTLEVDRSPLRARLVERMAGTPLLLAGPPGAGKTTLLRQVASTLEAQGWSPVYLDLMGAASSPDRFVAAALQALPAERFGGLLAAATELRRLSAAGRAAAAGAVQGLLDLWASLHEAGGRPVALLLDEPTEIRSLAYFAGLREVHAALGAALAARPRGTLLATSFPTQARRLWPGFEALEPGPLTAEELGAGLRRLGIEDEAGLLARASFGWPRYARILAARLRDGVDLASAWAEEMAPGGALASACHHTYEALLLRSRGYGMSKAVLSAVAAEEGLNLTALVRRLGRTPGAVRDYLGWLLGVDALRMVRKRYFYVDGLLRWWVRLHARGQPPEPAELRAAAQQALAAPPPSAGPEASPAGRPQPRAQADAEAESAAAGPRHDQLMEID